MRIGRRVGVDVGSARVGLATCDPEGVLATPVGTVARSDARSDLDEIADTVRRLAAIEVVVGLPRSLSGSEGPAAEAARAYAISLVGRLAGVPVRLLDERLTTVDAQRALREAGRPARQQRSVIDQVSAVLILQAALDLERASGRPPGEALGGRKPRHRGENAGLTGEGRRG
ncbi:MAG: Holliday junction resolvase RuvX [Austwickia sp.]|nr:Holliday junction resolvase RuvX [Austwickia sp.]